VAQDLAFVALADVAELFFGDEHPQAVLVGGQMVTLHGYRWGLGAELFRESRDVDTGVAIVALKDEALLARIESLGYERTAGNTFEKRVRDIPIQGSPETGWTAQIELLAPAFTSRARESVQHGDFAVTEVPGLAIAMQRTVTAQLRLFRLNDDRSDFQVVLPDEVGCLILRAHAWRIRLQDRDAVDVWRALEIASRAGVGPDAFVGPAAAAATIVRDAFGTETAPGIRAVLEGRRLVPTAPNAARVVALARATVGS
jgi:hypothetical protein